MRYLGDWELSLSSLFVVCFSLYWYIVVATPGELPVWVMVGIWPNLWYKILGRPSFLLSHEGFYAVLITQCFASWDADQEAGFPNNCPCLLSWTWLSWTSACHFFKQTVDTITAGLGTAMLRSCQISSRLIQSLTACSLLQLDFHDIELVIPSSDCWRSCTPQLWVSIESMSAHSRLLSLFFLYINHKTQTYPHIRDSRENSPVVRAWEDPFEEALSRKAAPRNSSTYFWNWFISWRHFLTLPRSSRFSFKNAEILDSSETQLSRLDFGIS